MRPARVYAYARVSGAEQGRTGTSLDAQREELVRYCKGRGFSEPQVRVEVESASAEKIERRAVLLALVAELRPGDLVVVCKVDRWSRDIVYAVQSVRALVARGIGWHAIGEGIDAATPNGDSMLGIMAWAADQERKRIYERTVVRRKALRDEGRYVEGLPPVGYERGPKSILRPVAADAAIVRDVFARCVRGESVSQIAEYLQVEHPERHGWDKATVGRMLRSRLYLGEVRTSAGAWIASHEPIVDRALWERAALALARRRHAGDRPTAEARTNKWLLRGLASCAGCERRMRASYGQTRDYYACLGECGAPYVRVDVVDPEVDALALARLVALRDDLAKDEPVPVERRERDYDARRERIRTRRERAVTLAIDGVLSREDLTVRLNALDAELGRLELRAAADERMHMLSRPEHRAALLKHIGNVARSWRRLPVPDRRAALGEMVDSIRVAKNEPSIVAWRPVEALDMA